MKNGMIECSVCHSKLVSPTTKGISRAYDRHKNRVSSKQRALNTLLVVGDCILVGLQPILVYMSKVDGKFKFSPISVNFLTEIAKVLFAVVMLIIQSRHQKVGEKPLLSLSTFMQAARNNVLLAVPAFLYAINNYLKFTMQLYFNPATVKMLSNLKVLVIAVLLKIIMRRRFSVIQWEALALLLIGISVNQLRSLPEGTTNLGLTVSMGAYVYTLIFVTVPSLASVYNEYALKSQYDTSIYLQNLFLYGYGAMFNFLGILGTVIIKGPSSFDILQGHSKATMLLIANNAAQGILSSFFFKYADTILKKYSSTVATIFTGIASAALFGHILTMNFVLGISIVFISMHQFFSSLSKVKDEQNGITEMVDVDNQRSKGSFVSMTAGANEEALVESDERKPLLPT
ncbi:CMP-sialic acid transporter 2-like [Cucurbita pepo subsp. pepo]|uniref:CMP-sialic acid transporter 2-like n=1 Tax=Cucurbita maxima TaxID=3661 RepID=A0A6J1KS23_CUCMA|nr:CMP-sialic acid transporter 2-like [Cucurbita maxima]XP_023005028.1 CMP-sialic acid transporter 2-like [Cucurbita maxima]XP_023514827.1 CMP-sialic acid transporter 2-like [Cucurbita pepo subsp. pepo]XP_023514828.1 CMP-sialic acid transporter 2-like [Cucurbita pepo subsp. pepo]